MGNTLDVSLLCRNKFFALELKNRAKANIKVIPYYITLLDFLIFAEEYLSKKISTDNSPQSSSNFNIFSSFKVFLKLSQQKQSSRIVKKFQIWQFCVNMIWYIGFRSKIDFRQLLANFVGDKFLNDHTKNWTIYKLDLDNKIFCRNEVNYITKLYFYILL